MGNSGMDKGLAHPGFIERRRRLEAAGPLGSDGKGGILPPLFVVMGFWANETGMRPQRIAANMKRGSKPTSGMSGG